MKPPLPFPDHTGHDSPCAWQSLLSGVKLRSKEMSMPIRLRDAAPQADWPSLERLHAWLQAERLRLDDAQLWCQPGARGMPAVPLDPRQWTHERRLGDQVLRGIPSEPALNEALQGGGWLHLRHLHRIDSALAQAMAAAQAVLGMPLRAHAWRGQARSAARPARLWWPATEAAALSLLIVVEGELSLTWHPPVHEGANEGGAAVHRSRKLRAQAGDLLILPPAAAWDCQTHRHVWAVELRAQPLTLAEVLMNQGTKALQTLRDDPALRRCAMGAHQRKGANDLQRLANTLRAEALGDVRQDVRSHHALVNEDVTGRVGRLSAVSQLMQATGQTPLIGRPDRIQGRHLSAGHLTLRLTNKELHFDGAAIELLDFMLQAQPYQLGEAPGRHAVAARLQLARSLAIEGLVEVA